MNVLILPPERQDSMRLRDGRVLAWSEWGPIDGLPVLFCTGAGMSGWLGFGASDLAKLNVRLLAIDWPGLGRSDPHLNKTFASGVEDTQAWIATNTLHRVTAVGFSQGAPFACALAERGVVEALAIVAGQDELAHPSIRPLLHPDVERMIAAIEHNTADFERWLEQIATPDGLWQFIIGMSGERDQALYTSARFGATYQRVARRL